MIRTETGSGASHEHRPELGIILDFKHPDETLLVKRIDCLARSLRDLRGIVAKLKEKGAHLSASKLPVDASSATGKAFFAMLVPLPSSGPPSAVNARPRELSRPSGGAAFAGDP